MNELLAGALNDLSNRHSNLGHKDEALAAIEEAVEIRRKLAESYPQIFLSPLIRSLHIQSEILIELGRESEAQSVKDEIARQLRGPD
jgi:tetratricopeptide (TPR) repeat protein